MTPKQRKFVAAYLETGMNATEAAKRAGYSPKTAYSQGWRLLQNSTVKAAIEAALRTNTLSAAEVLARLSEQARADMADFTTEDGLLDMRRARESGRLALVKRLKIRNKRVVEIELYSAQGALALLAKYHGLLTERVRLEDWQHQAIEDIKAGRLEFDALALAFGDESLVQDLFRRAGVKVVTRLSPEYREALALVPDVIAALESMHRSPVEAFRWIIREAQQRADSTALPPAGTPF